MRSVILAASTLAAVFSLPALSADKIKPGLWDVTVDMNLGANAPPIPPGALEQMQQMGLEVPFAQPITRQTCITPEQAAQDKIPAVTDAQSGCSVTNSKRSGNNYSAEMVCNGQMQGKGSMNMTLQDPKHYSGTMKFQGAGPGGMPIDMTSTAKGTWVSADCGGVAAFD